MISLVLKNPEAVTALITSIIAYLSIAKPILKRRKERKNETSQDESKGE